MWFYPIDSKRRKKKMTIRMLLLYIRNIDSLMRKTKNVDDDDEWWPKPDLPEIKFKEHTTKN